MEGWSFSPRAWREPTQRLALAIIARSWVMALPLLLAACAGLTEPPPRVAQNPAYRIGPGDDLRVFVWQNQELTTSVIVQPDGRVSLPLVRDLSAAGKTPTQLAHDIESRL